MRAGIIMVFLRPIAFAIALTATAALEARTLNVAAAADLQFALPALARDFERRHADIQVKPAFGSSGNFAAEIANGAPFDLFLSADTDYPRTLIGQGAAAADSFFVYGTGHLALWVAKNSPLDLARLGMRALDDASVKHIAIANPRHAPYGRAAEAALRSAGEYGRAAPRLAMGENVAQAFEFVQTGAAEIGMVALSLALAPSAKGEGRYWSVPAERYPKLEQAGVILTHARERDAARDFRAFLLSDSARATLQSFGF